MQTTEGKIMESEENNKKANWKKRLKQLGFIGFMFFLIKGLVWLAVFFWGAKIISGN
ncbi:MAG: hypothetical protein M0D57_19875 [Sphingobacteriales bacterium JAD_PAG50586_3]|nr:MAG: hypothetical protein M0D57_19875 [Sphingobacteriales bacterium JAD_PAG50586_3]